MDSPLIKLSDKEYQTAYTILSILGNSLGDSSNPDYRILSKGLNFNEIKKLLKRENYEITDEEIHKCIWYLYITKGVLVKDSFIGKEDEYRLLLDNYYFQSSYQEGYRKFEIVNNVQRAVLISDTHIGNEKIEDYKKIISVYDYAKQVNVDFIFHLGDLFDRMDEEILTNPNQMYLNQLNSFIENYPKDVTTYCILGNHDNNLHKFFQGRMMESFDLRGLSYYNPKFYMFPNNDMRVNISNSKIHFAHRIYLNWLIRSVKMNNLEDLYKYEALNSSDFDIHISGHLHDGFIANINDDFSDKQNLYIGVPSLIKEKEGTIALQLDFNYSNNELLSIKITPLYCIGNKTIPGEENIWYMKEKNKEIRKVL